MLIYPHPKDQSIQAPNPWGSMVLLSCSTKSYFQNMYHPRIQWSFSCKVGLYFTNSSAVIPTCLSAPWSAQAYGRQQKQALLSPHHRKYAWGRYTSRYGLKGVMSKTSWSMIRGFVRIARAIETYQHPGKHFFCAFRIVIELLPIMNRFVEFLIRLITPISTPCGCMASIWIISAPAFS